MDLLGRTTERDEQKAAAYGEWVRQRDPLAIASLVLGVFSLIEFGVLLVPGIAGIVLGVLALARLKRINAIDQVEETQGDRILARVPPFPSSGTPGEGKGGGLAANQSPLPCPPPEYRRREIRECDRPVQETAAGPARGHGLAWAGIVLSAVSLVLAAWVYWMPPAETLKP